MIDVTVIGAGVMGENHIHAVSDHPALKLAAVVDIDSDRATEVAERYDAQEALTDYEQALNDVDAAVIATPESVHVEQASAALDRGVHILLEKPVAETLDDARALAERASRTDLTTGVSFVLRYDPAYAKVQKAVQNGALGDLVSVRGKRSVTSAESRRVGHNSHPLFYFSIHDIDAMLWCVDQAVERVVAVDRWGELEDIDSPDAHQALLTFKDGTIGVLEGYGILPETTPGGIQAALEVVGTDGTAAVETPGTYLSVNAAGAFDYPDTRHWPIVNERMDGAVRRQIDRFADAILGQCDGMLATISDGARAHATANAIWTAIETSEAIEVDS